MDTETDHIQDIHAGDDNLGAFQPRRRHFTVPETAQNVFSDNLLSCHHHACHIDRDAEMVMASLSSRLGLYEEEPR